MGFRMTFYMALISAVCMFFLCLFSHQLCLPQTLAGWLAALAFSLMICIGAGHALPEGHVPHRRTARSDFEYV